MQRHHNGCFYGINCDYASRREFHRPFWDALRAAIRHFISRAARAGKSGTTSI